MRVFSSVRLLVFCALLVSTAAAQQRDSLVSAIIRDDGTVVQLPAARRGFTLFAEEELAGTSLKLKGTYRWAQFNGGGLCTFAGTNGDLFNSACGGGTFFHLQAAWGVPPSAYLRIREAWPRVAEMRPPVGYSTPWRITNIAPLVMRIGPADGQFGTWFSGLTSANGAGCRDMSGAQGAGVPVNFPLTAASDCAETWGPAGFAGMRAIPDSAWLGRFRENPSAFRWEDWRIAPAASTQGRVVGDLVRQLSWTPSDLVARGDNSPHGDLPYDLTNRAGSDLASGLYVFVLNARGPNANGAVHRGKFVVVR